MEFNEKLQELRRRKGLTQEELAEVLFVSRTAISKWESGRGLPSIESLKAISVYFSISLDELLSGKELLSIAETDQKENQSNFRDLIFGLLDCCIMLLLILPFFGQKTNSIVHTMSLLNLTQIPLYLKVAYLVAILATMLFGLLTLAFQNWDNKIWVRSKHALSLILSTGCTCLFIISQQPYAAIFTLMFCIIKIFVLFKKR